MELLHQATLEVKLLSLVPLGASMVLLPLLAALRFLRRGPARFWLAPSFLLFALLPSTIGAAISAWLLRSTREMTMFGGESLAVTAHVLELQMPLLAGLLGSAVVLLFSLLLIAFSTSPASQATEQSRPAVPILALGLSSLVAALLILEVAAARAIASGSAAGEALAWWTMGLGVTVVILLFAGGILLIATAPAGAAPSTTRVLHLRATGAAALLCTVALIGGVAAANRGLASRGTVVPQPGYDQEIAGPADLAPPASAIPDRDATVVPATPAASSDAALRSPLRVGSDIIDPPQKLRHIEPEYPADARRARIQGAVVLECTISPQGEVSDVRVVKGHPLLNQAAVDAVRQWQFAPTLVDGTPVSLLMTVTVRFGLQ